jgi:bacillithiol biosynthesis cysteine-adding enzyme BshC
MDPACIPYTRVPHSSTLLLDYLYHYDRVARFYSGAPHDLASYKSLASGLPVRDEMRRQVCEVLARQNTALGSSEAAMANIQRLSDPGTFAVVTGQQVGLFSGPAYTVYKVLTAVRLAQHLTGQGLRTVPVFWLATEDHDLKEVAEAATFDEEYNLIQLCDAGERPAARSPVGEVKLTAQCTEALNQLESILPAGEPRAHLLHDLRETFQPGAPWGAAFGRLMARLFAPWGVILLDPHDETLHRITASVYEQAIRQAPELRAHLLERTRALNRQGYHAQVHVGEDSTLVFAARDGNRAPIHHRDGEYWVDGTERATLASLEESLRTRPLDFSGNVLLRSIVQDALLPTLAYVAGPSELAYLGQSQALYEAFGRPQPIVFLRAAFTLVDQRTQRLMDKYRLAVEDVWQGEEHLSKCIAAAGFAGGWAERFDQSERDLRQLLERLHQDVEKLDPTLLDTLQHVKEKMTYQLERLKGKVSRAALGRSELLARHQQGLLRFLLPHKDLQERRVSGIYFLGRAGYEILERLLAQIHTHCSDHQVLTY